MQIALPLAFDRQFSFENYFSSRDGFLVDSLKSLLVKKGEVQIGLWGGNDSGKTHLLNACVEFARQHTAAIQLYDARHLADYDAGNFSEIEGLDILVIDNLDLLCGHREWEQVFYRILNHCRDGNLRLIFSMSQNPLHLQCELADFQSRLCWGLILQLPGYDEATIELIVKYRARLLGLELSKEVMAYLLTHFPRKLATQLDMLRLLDRASLSTQRRISVPLIKQTLSDYLI